VPRLNENIETRIKANPEARVLWWNGKWLDGHLFRTAVNRTSRILRKSGFREGSRLVVFMPNCPALWFLSVASWQLGGTIVPLNARGGNELTLEIVKHINPSGIIVTEGMEDVNGIFEGSGFPVAVSPAAGAVRPFDLKQSEPSDPEIAVIFATSGTTGTPKAVPVRHANLYDNARKVHENIEGFESGRTVLNVLPNFHSFGFTVCGVLPLLCGLPMVLVPSFIPVKNTLEALEAAEVETMVSVPAMLPFLEGACEKTGVPLPALRYILTGGGKLGRLLEERIRVSMHVICFEGYGLTECSPVVSCNPSEKTRKPGTVGPPLPGYEIQIRDLDNNPMTSSSEGVLWVRGPSVVEGYFNAPELTAERFVDGWFNTGDIVHIDEDGYITILDRASDLIIVGGFNVYPQEIETVLSSHPAVRAAAVVGMHHGISGEVPKAFVVPEERTDVTSQELIQHAKKHLAHFKVPRKISFMNELPLSSTGKVLRRALRERNDK